MMPLDYLLIGHVTKDITPAGPQLGGTVSFSGQVAAAMGANVGVLTSAHPDYDLSQLQKTVTVRRIAAAETTTFENVYTPAGRVQSLFGRAARLLPAHVPAAWLDVPVVHLAPVDDEVDEALIDTFAGRIVGLTPQGWLRGWDDNGRIHPQPWLFAADYLPKATAVIFSEEDLPDDDTLAHYRQWANLLVMTTGANGCTVFTPDESRHIAAPSVQEVETTGAGDIFAAAFLIEFQRNGRDPFAAAHFANTIAAQSVTQVGLHAKIQQIKRHLAAQTAPGAESS